MKLITADEAADKLATTKATLANWRSTGHHNIPYLKLGEDQQSAVRYVEEEIDKWIESKLIGGDV